MSERLILGTVPFGSVINQEDSANLIKEAWDLGFTEFDVANLYGNGLAAEILGKTLAGKNPKISCSIGLEQVPDQHGVFAVNVTRLHHNYLRQSTDLMLKSLRVETLEFLNIHAPDYETDLSETLLTLNQLKLEGKIQKISFSNMDLNYLKHIRDVSLETGIKVSQIQIHGNMLERRIVTEFKEIASDIPIICYRPLARGLLGREYSKENIKPLNSRAARGWRLDKYLNSEILEILEHLQQLAQSNGMTQTQFAMAWLLKIEKVAGVVFGVRDSTQLEGIHSYKTMDFNQKVLDQIREFADSDKVVAISEKMPEVYFEK